ncbi:DNA translocase FtsK 4TM domain-containing protein [Spirosoma sp. BT702]|uniref:DNA translocase FtsK 4TM domain-containing protein n=1 Tax=Spirosoma profusum TaxID=2771354 RepID=A0A926XZK8_9BACT|nr:DNA translocase FtsK [Spirosoma profusum]MBD2703854.1 DNA translocase FtsK 4TM domain-containing protein [Spirosoma profusum]
MAQPTTPPRQNTIRRPVERNEPRAPRPKPSASRTKAPSFNWGAALDRWFTDQRSTLTLGVLTMAVAIGLLFAFVSYLFNGTADQSVVGAALSEPLTETAHETRNWAGVVGAYIAHVFVFRWFGIGALAFPIIVFLAGYKLTFRRELLPLSRTTTLLLFMAFWTSLMLGYIVLVSNSAQTASVWCGGLGYETNVALYGLIGWGNLAFIAFLLFVFVVYFVDIRTIQLPNLSLPSRPRPVRSSANPLQTYDESEYEDDEEEEFTADEPRNNVRATPTYQDTPYTNGTSTPDANVAEQPASMAENVAKTTGVTFSIKNRDAVADDPVVDEEQGATPSPTFEPDPFEDDDLVALHGLYDPTSELSQYQYPTNELLTDYQNSRKAQVSDDELTANKERIENTLRNFGIEIDSIQASIGPTVTLYEIVPAKGVRISKIKSLEDDIALSLSALGIRIIAPMPGMGTIGIEVPNKNREMVSMRSVITSDIFSNSKFDLPIVLGKTISNEIYVADLAKMPHLLMAGATGQGKSVGLNVLLTSLIYRKHPSQLKLVLVDPKKVELTLFNKLERHFLAKLPDSEEPIITDTKKVVNTLNSLCIEMDRRYDLLKDAGCRNLKEYNAKFVKRRLNPEKGHRFLPYIVLIVDELADLMMTAGKEVEQPIARLAQLARAIGIHLVVATQRPSVNVITGLIKANFPARLSFKVTSKIDSRTILDTGGAEQLVGMGDMLLSSNSEIIRLQCPFVDTNEIEEICEYVGNQRGYDEAYALPEFVGDDGGQSDDKDVDLGNRDPMFDEAARLIVIHQQGSTSLIQRKLKLGYNRAGRLVDQLEAAKIVGPFEGSKARDVLVQDLQMLEELLKRLKGE